MKVLVTGAAGFIGSTLCEKLTENNIHCVGIDKLTNYYDVSLKRSNLKSLKSNDKFSFHESDVMSEKTIGEIKNADVIFHLSAQPGVFKSWGKDFQIYVRENIEVTQFILEILKDYPEKKLVFASSSSVYGKTNTYPMREDNILRPISPYGLTKLACERLLDLYSISYGLKYLSLRFFTVFGPRQRADMAFHKFFKSVIKNEPINIYGNGEQIRDFTYVAAVVDFLYKLIDNDKWNYEVNVGGGASISVNEVLNMIFEITGKETKVNYIAHQKGDMKKTLADISLARDGFNYSPEFSLFEGLKKEWEWIQTIYKVDR